MVRTSASELSMRITSALLLAMLAVSGFGLADAKDKGTKLLSSWSDPSVKQIPNRKVLVVFQSSDADKRKLVETEMAKLIPGSIIGYTVLPEKEMLKDSEATRFLVKRSGADFVITMRFNGTVPSLNYKEAGVYKAQVDMISDTGDNYHSGGMYGYWSNGWKDEYRSESLTKSNKTIAQFETKIFAVKSGKLAWSSKSQTYNPKDMDAAVSGVIKANVDGMRKSGLIK